MSDFMTNPIERVAWCGALYKQEASVETVSIFIHRDEPESSFEMGTRAPMKHMFQEIRSKNSDYLAESLEMNAP
jgi:hypothetical protein